MAKPGKGAGCKLSVAAAPAAVVPMDVCNTLVVTVCAAESDVDVTSKVTSHAPPMGTNPPAYVAEPCPAVAVNVPPVQVVDAFGAAAMVISVGSGTVMLSACAAKRAVELSIDTVNVVVPPCTMLLGAKAAVRVGTGAAVTFSTAAAVPLFPSDVVSGADVLVTFPACRDWTSTE